MDRKLVLDAPVAIARGHRIEVVEHSDAETGATTVAGLLDLDTGIRYRWAEHHSGEPTRWIGRVLECAVTFAADSARTALLLAEMDQSGAGAKVALRGADAAVEAAKAEADRWGGADRAPVEEPERFW